MVWKLPAGSRCRPGHQLGSPVGRYTATGQSTEEHRKGEGEDSNRGKGTTEGWLRITFWISSGHAVIIVK